VPVGASPVSPSSLDGAQPIKTIPLSQQRPALPRVGPLGARGSRDTACDHYDGPGEHRGERHPGKRANTPATRRTDVDRRDLP
jgi:hypothetical protein